MRTSQQLMLRIAEAQAALAPALQRLGERRDGGRRRRRAAHLRNIELYLQRLLAEAEQGRAQSTAELRNDLRILTRTVAALAEDQPQVAMAADHPHARGDNGLYAWPGYVDALSTLLMVIIFVLLVFVLAQAFLSVVLSGRDKQLDRVNQQLAELTDMLSLERGHSADLQQSIAQLNRELAAATGARHAGAAACGAAGSGRAAADRDTLRAERDRLASSLPTPSCRRVRAARRAVAEDLLLGATQDAAAGSATSRRSSPMRSCQLAAMQLQAGQMAELDKTVHGRQGRRSQARLSDLAKLAEQNARWRRCATSWRSRRRTPRRAR